MSEMAKSKNTNEFNGNEPDILAGSSQIMANGTGTSEQIGTELTQAGSRGVPVVRVNEAKTIKKMLQMRSAIGADTPAGHRISNIDEVRQNKAKADDPVQIAYLDASLGRQLRDLAATRNRKAGE
ncbi:MAG TPA: hypothetical protein VK494_09390 [Gemmatimonadaceae bacterium]|nr:hypothetical protein [Gemmatimonadaceae bacterium]